MKHAFTPWSQSIQEENTARGYGVCSQDGAAAPADNLFKVRSGLGDSPTPKRSHKMSRTMSFMKTGAQSINQDDDSEYGFKQRQKPSPIRKKQLTVIQSVKNVSELFKTLN